MATIRRRSQTRHDDSGLMLTYSVLQPVSEATTRPATCAEVGCRPYHEGWQINALVLTEQHYADLKAGGWAWTVIDVSATEQYLLFSPGQRCLAHSTHRIHAADRPSIYVVRDGKPGRYRGTRRLHGGRRAAADWKDDMQNHLSTVADDRRKG